MEAEPEYLERMIAKTQKNIAAALEKYDNEHSYAMRIFFDGIVSATRTELTHLLDRKAVLECMARAQETIDEAISSARAKAGGEAGTGEQGQAEEGVNHG